jgi:hypothetical protein
MGTHQATQRDDRLGGLVGRGVLTAAAALALAGGGTGVAYAGDVPGDDGPDTSQAQDHGDDCSCGDHDGDRDQDRDDQDDGWQDQDDEGGQDQDGHPDPDAPHAQPRPHHGDTTHASGGATGSHAPTTERIRHGATRSETVPITSGVMR